MQKIFEEFCGVIVNIIARLMQLVNSAQKIFYFLCIMLRYRSIVVGFSGNRGGRLLLPQPPPRLLKNIRTPQLRSHFLYPLTEKGKRFANNTAFHPSSYNPKVDGSIPSPAPKLKTQEFRLDGSQLNRQKNKHPTVLNRSKLCGQHKNTPVVGRI